MEIMELKKKIDETVSFLEEHGMAGAEVCVILGSGLNNYADRIKDPIVISYNDIPNMQAGLVSDHRGQMICGEHRGRKVILLAGRFHYYESGDMQKAAFPARVMVGLGVRRFIITNAAGSVNADFGMGRLMLISDHINLSGSNPLIGSNIDEFGPRFPDMTYTYDRDLREKLKSAAAEKGIELCEGVYSMFSGPCFETPAEIRYARTIGADAVGMSTVPEAIVANHAGKEIIGISFLSNMAAGMLDKPLSGEEVTEASKGIQDVFADVVDLAISL